MQVVTILAVALLGAVSVFAVHINEFYDESFDIDQILANHKIVESYCNCLLEPPNVPHSKCTPQGKDLKKVLPDAITSKCEDCTPFQAHRIRKVCRTVKTHFPAKWEALVDKYDKDGKAREDFEKFLAKDD